MPRKKNSRAAHGAGSIRQRKNGKWEARYTLGFDHATGKPIRKSIYGDTQAEVQKKLTAILHDINNDEYFEPSKMTFAQYLDDIWLKDCMMSKKYTTVKSYTGYVNNHIKPVLGHMLLGEIKRLDIQRFYNKLLTSGGKSPKRDENGDTIRENGKIVYESVPLSVKTLHNIHGVMTKAFGEAVKLELIKKNPAEGFELPKVIRSELTPLMDSQIKDFLSAVEKDRFANVLKVIPFCGFRIGEVTGLTWDCINWTKGTIKVYRQIQKRPNKDGGLVFAPLKNNKSREIKPAPFVMDILKQQYEEQTALREKMGDEWTGWTTEEERKTALVFTMDNGRPINPATLWRHFKAIAAEIGVASCRVHDLRHTFAILSLENGDDALTVSNNLGHAKPGFTLSVYGHVSETMRNKSSERMQEYYESLKCS